MKGTVVDFNDSKGYGFIQPDDQQEQVFVHATAVTNRTRLADYAGALTPETAGRIRRAGRWRIEPPGADRRSPATPDLQPSSVRSGSRKRTQSGLFCC